MMTTYPVNGSLALKPRAYGNQSFTVIEGGSARVDAQAPSFMAQLHQCCALIMVGLFACVLLAGAYMVLDAPAQAYQAAYESTELQAVTVSAGDSLWSLAESYPVAGVSTKEVTHLIEDWNDLSGGLIQPGDTLLVAAHS